MRNSQGGTKNRGCGDKEKKTKIYKYLRGGQLYIGSEGKGGIQNDSEITGLGDWINRGILKPEKK